MTTAVCTLFEGDYHFGVAGLVNSLYRCGFRGNVWAGYRGQVPPWCVPLADDPATNGLVLDGIRIRLVKIPAGWHLAHMKPNFMRQVMLEHDPKTDGVFYFDPDIVSEAPWSFYESWILHGVALCEDSSFARLPDTHPFRAAWKQAIAICGLTFHRDADYYVNSGFVGLGRENIEILEIWHALLCHVAANGADFSKIKPVSRSDPFSVPDQDALNCAVMASRRPLSLVGPDGMGFIPSGFIMQHAVSSIKPWRAKYFSRLVVHGDRPSLAHKAFWENMNGPITPMSRAKVCLTRLSLMMAVMVSRFYQR